MTVKRLSNLDTRRLPDGRRMLLVDLVMVIDDVRYVVPRGLVTDYSSVPFGLRWACHWTRVDIAGVVHDWLYKSAYLTRRDADRIWREVALAGKRRAHPVQGYGGWLLLRIGGWYAWEMHRLNDRR